MAGRRTAPPEGMLPLQFGYDARRHERVYERIRLDPSYARHLQRAVIVFADLRNSTQLIKELRPLLFRALVEKLFRVFRDCVLSQGGVVEKFLGDGGLALFVPRSTVPGDDESPGRGGPAVRASRAVAETIREFERLIAPGGWFEGEHGTRRPAPAIALGASIVCESCVLGCFGPLHDRNGRLLPLQYACIGEAPSLAQRVCEHARIEKLTELSERATDALVGRPGLDLSRSLGEEAVKDYLRQWGHLRDSRSVVLADMSVMGDERMKRTIEREFAAVQLPFAMSTPPFHERKLWALADKPRALDRATSRRPRG